MPHPLGEEYELWCEMNPCPRCWGGGACENDDGEWEDCPLCGGVGLDPLATFESEDGGSVVVGMEMDS